MGLFIESQIYIENEFDKMESSILSAYDRIVIESFNSINNDFLLESGDTNDYIGNAIEKVKTFFNKIIEKIKSLFVKSKANEIPKAIDKLKQTDEGRKKLSKKVKRKERDKLDELNQQTLYIVDKSKSTEEIIRIRKMYRQKRNKLLATSALVTVSLGAALTYVSKQSKTEVKSLQTQVDRLTDRLSKLRNTSEALATDNKKLKSKNDELRKMNKFQKAVIDSSSKTQKTEKSMTVRFNAAKKFNTIKGDAEVNKEKAQTVIEIGKNIANDAIDRTQEAYNILKENGILGSVDALSTVGAIPRDAGDRIRHGNTDSVNKLTEEIRSLTSKGRDLKDNYDKFKEKLGDIKDPSSRKQYIIQLNAMKSQMKEISTKINAKKKARTDLLSKK